MKVLAGRNAFLCYFSNGCLRDWTIILFAKINIATIKEILMGKNKN
jgi:hypothetical protein